MVLNGSGQGKPSRPSHRSSNLSPSRGWYTPEPMKISREEVRNVALLARLELSPEEEAAFGSDLDEILSYVTMLEELDTSAVEPTAHVVEVETPFRDDVVTNHPDAEALVAGAPARDATYFKVPKIIE